MIKNIMQTKPVRGFTLIEILIVIAIIGILAAVVVTSLNSARDKGADAVVKSNLHGLEAEAAIYYDDNNRIYTGVCTTDQIFIDAMAGAISAVSPAPVTGGLGDGECLDSDTEWAAWVNMKSASTSAWCVDSTGKSVEIAVQDSTAVDLLVCP